MASLACECQRETTRQVSTVGHVKDSRHGPVAKGPPAQRAQVLTDLVPRWTDEINKLKLEYGTHAVTGHTDPHTGDSGLGQWRIERSIGMVFGKTGR